jgi:carbon storage regulator
MLLLKRRVGESIVIGGTIRVSVVEVRGGSVRIAIDAPGDTSVYRAELLDKLGEENARAMASHVRTSRRPPMNDATINFPEGILGMGGNTAFVMYDLVKDSYSATIVNEQPVQYGPVERWPESNFTPESMAARGVR